MRAEVYDAAGTELIGYLEGVGDLKATRANSVTVVLDKGSDGDPPFDPWTIKPYRPTEYMALEIGRMSRQFDRSLMIRDPLDFEAMIASVIPEHAESVQDIEHQRITYHWKVLKMPPKPEDAEKLFELDTFEPEGRSCASWSAEERWWAKRGAMPGQHRGGITPAQFRHYAKELNDLSSLPMPVMKISKEERSFGWRTESVSFPLMKPKPIINPGC